MKACPEWRSRIEGMKYEKKKPESYFDFGAFSSFDYGE